jgi:hypothetical protein
MPFGRVPVSWLPLTLKVFNLDHCSIVPGNGPVNLLLCALNNCKAVQFPIDAGRVEPKLHPEIFAVKEHFRKR